MKMKKIKKVNVNGKHSQRIRRASCALSRLQSITANTVTSTSLLA
jgi:hypothetical protein